MNKKILCSILSLMIVVTGLVVNVKDVSAETQSANWSVEYDGSALVSNYNYSDAKNTIAGTMPGDTIVYEVSYVNNSSKSADFYMSSDVISTLEENKLSNTSNKASGGAYSYSISYDKGNGTTVIYDSATIGGDVTEDYLVGLKQAASTNDNYFYVGNIEPGKSGKVVLKVSLDGNTQDNSYMTTLAELGIKFGVEETGVTTNKVVYTLPGGTEIVKVAGKLIYIRGPKTGDSILPLVLCGVALILGILLVLYYFGFVGKQNKEGEEYEG